MMEHRSTEKLTCQVSCELGYDGDVGEAREAATKVLESMFSLLTFAVGIAQNKDQIAQLNEKFGASGVIMAPTGEGITAPILAAGDIGESVGAAVIELQKYLGSLRTQLRFNTKFGVPHSVTKLPTTN